MTNLFLKIVNMSISAGWLILAVILLRPLLKRAPRWITVALWGLAGIRLAFPFSIESIFSLIPSRETISPEIVTDSLPAVNTGIPALDGTVNPVINTSLAPAVGDSVNPLQVWVFLFAVVWMLGMTVLFCYTAVSYRRLHKRVATAIPISMGRGSVRENIFQSERVESPFVLGIIRPRIYLPFAISNRDVRVIVAHEQAHIRRRDHWWKPLGFLLLTIHWFNPLVWIAYILFCRDIEFACDEKVIRELDNDQRADYSQALLSCSVSRKGVSACPLAFGEAGVQERVRLVLNYRRPAFWMILGAVIACAAVALCFLTDPAAGMPDGSAFQDAVIWEDADLDHDGEPEFICVREVTEGGYYELEVVKRDGTVLWSREAGTVHTGRIAILLYESGGEDYLVEYVPAVYQGMGSYTCTQFFLEGGVETEENRWTADFQLPIQEMTEQMGIFAEAGNRIMKEGIVLLSTVEGDPVIGPASAAETAQLYPVHFDPAEENPDAGMSDGSAFQDTVIWEDADLDHDGEAESVFLREIRKGETYQLGVAEKDGTLLWVSEDYSPHLESGVLLLYQSGGEDYLVKYYVPYLYQGIEGTVSCTCIQFSLEGGVETEENRWTADFELPVAQMTGKMRAFAEVGNMIMKDGTMLLGTVGARLVVGPRPAAEISQLYPVHFYPEEMAHDAVSGEGMFAGSQPLEFLFASGAGGWGTWLTLYPDGHFEGAYEDGENVAAPEYPRGTCYICKFSGSFSGMKQISEYAYSMQLEELNCETEAEQVWIDDGIRYIGSEALGIEGGEEFILYLPETSPEWLDEEFLSWWPDAYLWRDGTVDRLSSYGLHNVNTGEGFFTSWLQ